jgi:hypothetical protein
MTTLKRMSLLGLAAAAFLVSGSALAATATPVMTGLDNPRGLAFGGLFGKRGALYVAEAGRGGAGPCQILRGAPQCYGPTGRISRLWRGVQSAVVTGLPSYVSLGGQDAGSATGLHDIAVLGHRAVGTLGWGENPALRNTPPAAVWQQFGHLVRANLAAGTWSLGVDVSAYEAAANPDGGPVDSNPYGILGTFSFLGTFGPTYVTEAGGNALLRVAGQNISTRAVFPSRSTTPPHPSCVFPGFPPITDSVPTAVTIGPDGAFYVGELTGAPFCAGSANVYRVVPGRPPTLYCGGFTTIIDLTFGPNGRLYVAEHSNGPVFFATPGDVVRVGRNCSKTVVTPPLNRPGGIAFGPDRKLYVSVNSDEVGTGQVVRID